MPSWLAQPGPVLLKRHVRDKSDPLVDEVELLHANPHYAFVRYPSGRETSVATKHLAPSGGGETILPSVADAGPTPEPDGVSQLCDHATDAAALSEEPALPSYAEAPASPQLPRRSERVRRPVDRFGYSSFGAG